MNSQHPRLVRERETIEKMVELYCHSLHGSPDGGLCTECADLVTYAAERLYRCPFQEKKSTCAKCTVHCYKPTMREKIRVIMRHSGPRMIRVHPLLAAAHLLDGLRKPPAMNVSQARKKER